MMEIKELSDTELKALGYEELMKIQLCQNNISAINQELTKRHQEKTKDLKLVRETKEEIN